ncbi:MAG: hypothetical protein KBA72_15270 [Thermoanaerobaculia bacterium]|nr:hypothetical protein [Thermoanaerobaculia bacterium]
MKVLSAEVVDGRLELPAGAAKEGATLVVLVPDGEEEGFRLSAEEQERLRISIAQADSGDLFDGLALLDELKR